MFVKVSVTPGVKKEEFKKKSDVHYIVRVKEKAERNMANTRVRELLAEELGVSVQSVRLIGGHRSPSKMFSIIQ